MLIGGKELSLFLVTLQTGQFSLLHFLKWLIIWCDDEQGGVWQHLSKLQISMCFQTSLYNLHLGNEHWNIKKIQLKFVQKFSII